MGWFDRAIREGVEQGIAEGIAKGIAAYCAPGGGLDAAVERVLWEHLEGSLSQEARLTALGFVWALRLCFRRHGSSYAEATDLANSTLRQYLADEKIKFGDPAYAWTRSAADDVAEEYELRHWEAAA